MNRPIHFEIHTPDPAKSQRFYEQVFGWRFEKFAGPVEYWTVKTGSGDGIDGGIKRPEEDGEARTINTVQVSSVDEWIPKIEKAGGKIVKKKMAIPGVGWLAYFTEPGGAIVGIMNQDKNAK